VFSDPWHLLDIDPDGRLIEELARQNRKMVFLDRISPEVKDILAKAGIQ